MKLKIPGLLVLVVSVQLSYAQHPPAETIKTANAMGVNINRVFSIAFSLASCLGGAAGVMVGMYYNAVYATMGEAAGLKGFAACIFGGLTSIPGAILGGLTIGIVENLTVQYLASGYRDIMAFLVMVVVLVFRPQGLLGRTTKMV